MRYKNVLIAVFIVAVMVGGGVYFYISASAPYGSYVMQNKPDTLEGELKELIYGIQAPDNRMRLDKALKMYGKEGEGQLSGTFKSSYSQKEIVAYYRDVLRAYGWSDFTHEEKFRYSGFFTKQKYFDGYTFYKGIYKFELRFVADLTPADKLLKDNDTVYNILVEIKRWWKI